MTGTLTVLILSLHQFLLFLQFGLQQKITGMSNLHSNSCYARLLFSYTKVKIIQCLMTWNANTLIWVIYGKYKKKKNCYHQSVQIYILIMMCSQIGSNLVVRVCQILIRKLTIILLFLKFTFTMKSFSQISVYSSVCSFGWNFFTIA